jgi:hypothetical protein
MNAMRTTMRRLVAGILGGLLAGLLSLPMLAHADVRSAEAVEMEFEGWWFRLREPLAPVPPAPDPVRDGTEIPRATLRGQTNVYNGEFLRVGVNAGEPEAFAAISFPLFELGGGFEAIVTGGTVTFVQAPVRAPNAEANSGANGQRGEDIAAMAGCLVTQLFAPDLGGNWEDAPPFDPEVCSPLVRQEGVEPATWVLDLEPFVATWADPMANHGVAIVPDPQADPDGLVTWHVAFDNKFNDRDGATPPAADLTYTAQDLDDAFDFGFDEDFEASGGFDDAALGSAQSTGQGGAPSGSSVSSSPPGGFGGGFDGGGFGTESGDLAFDPEIDNGDLPIAAPEQAVAPPAAAGGGQSGVTAAAPVASGQVPGQVPGRHPAVFLLPLVGMGLVGLVGYSLRSDPVLPADRDGAVSRLMRRA